MRTSRSPLESLIDVPFESWVSSTREVWSESVSRVDHPRTCCSVRSDEASCESRDLSKTKVIQQRKRKLNEKKQKQLELVVTIVDEVELLVGRTHRSHLFLDAYLVVEELAVVGERQDEYVLVARRTPHEKRAVLVAPVVQQLFGDLARHARLVQELAAPDARLRRHIVL